MFPNSSLQLKGSDPLGRRDRFSFAITLARFRFLQLVVWGHNESSFISIFWSSLNIRNLHHLTLLTHNSWSFSEIFLLNPARLPDWPTYTEVIHHFLNSYDCLSAHLTPALTFRFAGLNFADSHYFIRFALNFARSYFVRSNAQSDFVYQRL